jgi:hypothetical protein
MREKEGERKERVRRREREHVGRELQSLVGLAQAV